MSLSFPITISHAASIIYVNSTTGSDLSGDGSSGSPYKTFHKGYTEAISGDTMDLAGTFTWTDADEIGDVATTGYTISKDLTIQGQGASQTFIQSANSDNTADRRVFTTALANTVNFDKLTIRYGKQNSSSYGGGGILIYGTVTIDNSEISYNRASGSTGGGISVRGKLTIENSTIHNNVANYSGGGLSRDYYDGSGGVPGATDVMDITNCTISNNQVTSSVAYMEGGGVFYRRGEGTITNSTISNNQVVNGGTSRSTHGLGTGYESGAIKLKNNIIAGNILSTSGGDIGHRQNGSGTYVDNGGNIIGRRGYYSDGFTPATTSWMDATAYNIAIDGTYELQDGGSTTGTLNLNSTLAVNSNPNYTQTLAITSATSVAVNNGITGVNGNISVPILDQRTATRSGVVDIGAYEYAGIIDPPVINTLSPSDNATAVVVDSNLVITFSEIVDAETGNIIIYKSSDNSIFETIDVTSSQVTGTGTNTITINPTLDLASETSYYVQIDATAFDDTSSNSYAGITDKITWNFTTADAINPTALTFLPIDGTTALATNSNLVMTFSEAVDVETGNIIIYKSSDDSIFETIDVTSAQVTGSGTNTITINPTSDLIERTSYYIKIDATAFDDTASNSYAGIIDKIIWNFTTGDFTNPTISSFSPIDGKIDITINSNLVLTFSEIVNVEAGNIIIYKSSDDSIFETIDIASSQVTGSGTNTITIDSTDSFVTNTAYYVKIDSTSFDDVNGNSFAGITNTTSWNFTTIEDEGDNASIEVDDGNTYSTDNDVVLDILGTNTLSEVTEMIISESPNFTGAEWEAFSSSKNLNLSDGDGIKTVYVRYRDSTGNLSEIFVDNIIVDTIMTLNVSTVATQNYSESANNIETTDTTPTLTGVAEANSTVVVTINSDPITTSLDVGANGEWSWTPETELDLGSHNVTIVGTDLAGNTNTVTFGLNITEIVGDVLPVSGIPMIFWGFILELLLIGGFFMSLRLVQRRDI